MRDCVCQCQTPCSEPYVQNNNNCACECPTWTPSHHDCMALKKVQRDCHCECPSSCPGSGQIQGRDCRCACPFGTPTAANCPSGVVDPMQCECANGTPPIASGYCCKTTIPNFTPFQGMCWGNKNEVSCAAVPDAVCVWDGFDCLPDPPINTLDLTKGCAFRDQACALNSDCCSEVCRITGFCR